MANGSLGAKGEAEPMSALAEVRRLYRDIDALNSAISLLNWDRQVFMPSGGAHARTEQVLRLTRIQYQLLSSDAFARALDKAETNSDGEAAAEIRVLRRERLFTDKVPQSLIQHRARVTSEAYEKWKEARSTASFSVVAPYYKEVFEIAGEISERLGPRDHPYDNLIDLYEEGATFADATSMFGALSGPVRDLVRETTTSRFPIDDSLLQQDWDQPKLRDVAETILRDIGFDFGRGRLDIAPNAFCSGTTTTDIRMTTRPSGHIKGILSSSLHEMGHALYEQNGNPAFDGRATGGGVSLAVHESQSRLWENVIGRSAGFWQVFFPRLAEAIPSLAPLGADGFFRAFNKVSPEFIRVGADELTYNLHIQIRFELEVALITRAIAIDDLPEVWNEKYRDLLGISPPHDGLGCLQDVHWSRGSVGYFPTYVMGNVIGLQFWEKLKSDLGDPHASFAAGNFAPVLEWLSERIYRVSKTVPPRELVESITGSYLDTKPWLAYADAKYRDLYRL